MALTNAERQARHKAKLRGNVTSNGVTEEVPKPVTASNGVTVFTNSELEELAETVSVMITHLTEIDARLDRIEAVQAKAVTLGVSVPKQKYANPFSKESQAHGHMPDNSPLGRMFRGET